MEKAWWENVDFNLMDEENKEIKRLSREIVERMKVQNVLSVAKKLGDIIDYEPKYESD